MIPVAAGLLTVCGDRPGLGAITSLAIVAMAGMAAVSVLFVLGVVSFAASVDSYYIGMVFIFGWVFAASLAGRASGRLPRQIANCGAALGAAGLAGAVLLLAVSAPMPAYSLISDVALGAKVLLGLPVALYPVWLIVLSYRLPGHLADVVGSTSRPLEVVRVRRRAMGILFILSGVLFLAGVLDPPILPTWGGSVTDVMATASAHRTAWFASTWLITLSIVAGLAAVELLVRILDTDLARVGRALYVVGSALGLASTTYDLAVTSTLLGAPACPTGTSASSTGLTASARRTSPCSHRPRWAVWGWRSCVPARCPAWTGYVFLIATVLLLGQYAAFRGALPFPQFLAFLALGIAALAHRAPATPPPSREPAEPAVHD